MPIRFPEIPKIDEDVCKCKECGNYGIMLPKDVEAKKKAVMRYCRTCEAKTAHVTKWGSWSHG